MQAQESQSQISSAVRHRMVRSPSARPLLGSIRWSSPVGRQRQHLRDRCTPNAIGSVAGRARSVIEAWRSAAVAACDRDRWVPTRTEGGAFPSLTGRRLGGLELVPHLVTALGEHTRAVLDELGIAVDV